MQSKRLLKLDLLRLDGGTQPRTDIDHTVVDEYSDAYAAGAKFPAVIVFFDGKVYWLSDGFHRWWAARKAERKTILCEIRNGTQFDAQWFSYSANRTHGLHRDSRDKVNAVQAALLHPNAAKMSDRMIAEHVGVSNRMVTKYRSVPTVNRSQLTQSVSPASREGLDGKRRRPPRPRGGKPAEPVSPIGDNLPVEEAEEETIPDNPIPKPEKSKLCGAMEVAILKCWKSFESSDSSVVAAVLESVAERIRNGTIAV
jgi:hypothetical protein